MNRRVSGILVIALLFSLLATYLVYRVVTSRPGQSGPQTVMIVRAARTLDIGAILQDADLTTGPWVGPLPSGMATKKEPLLNRGVMARIYEGEPILDSRLAPVGAGGGLAATIPTGMRAVAVRVNDIVGVAGFAQPGMRVDVLIAGQVPESPGRDGAHVKTILQNIEVWSAGQNYQKDAEGKPLVVPVTVVNLLVNPEQAEILSLASNEARIQLVLRNPLDTEVAKTSGTSMQALYSGSPSAEPASAKPVARAPARAPAPAQPQHIIVPLPPIEIEVFNGGQLTQAKFAQPPAKDQPQPVGEKK
jgi:pilus assembly protein CpaB